MTRGRSDSGAEVFGAEMVGAEVTRAEVTRGMRWSWGRSVCKSFGLNPGRSGPGSFRPSRFGLGRFGQFLGWVVSA